MKYSQTAFRVLKVRYLSVLKKCALINAGLFIGLFFCCGEAAAMRNVDVSNGKDFYTALGDVDVTTVHLTGDITLENKKFSRDGNLQIDGGSHSVFASGEQTIMTAPNIHLTISNIGDTSDRNSKGFSGFHTNRGGGVFENLHGSTLSISNSVFTGNSSERGGAVYSLYAEVEKLDGIFIGNKASEYGGVMMSYGKVGTVSGYFEGNEASGGGAVYFERDGGAAAAVGSVTGIFIRNKANGGGAIHGFGSQIAYLNGLFLENEAKDAGGALYIGNATGAKVNIVADNSDTIFTDNRDKSSFNAIHNNSSIVNLNAGDAKLILNDGIKGENTVNREPVIHINQAGLDISAAHDGSVLAPTFGTVYLNDRLSGNKVNLYNGTLKLGSYRHNDGTITYGNFAKDVEFTAKGGMLDVGENKVTAGTATFENGSTLAVTITQSGHGSFSANKLTVDEGARLEATLEQGLISSGGRKILTLVSAQNDWKDNFTPIKRNNMYGFEKGGKAGQYLVTLLQTAGDVVRNNGGSQNNIGTAIAWVDGHPFAEGSVEKRLADKLSSLAQHDARGFNHALMALAPETAPAVRTQATAHTGQIFSAISTRLSSGTIASAVEGRSSGDSLTDGGATWVQLLANKAEIEDISKAYGFDTKSAGVALGIEKQINEVIKTGIGYGYTDGKIDAFMRNIDVDTHTVFAYGEYKPSYWFVNGIASYSFAAYDEHKNVGGNGYKAEYDVDISGLQMMGGYDGELKGTQITPSAGLRYIHIGRESYIDTANQKVAADNMDILTAVLDVKISKEFAKEKGITLQPEVRIAATYDLISDKENAVVGLGNGSAYMVESEQLKRFGLETGFGLNIEVNEQLETAIGYEGRFREDYTDHTGLISAKYKF